jgi:hypothetical protein
MRAAAITETCATQVVIQPGKVTTAGSKRRLWLSLGWLLDRGFM